MDEHRFDSLARTLAGEVNRRRVLRGAAAGLAAAVGLRGVRGVSAGDAKVGICHLKGNGSYVYITVAASAVPAHEAHGDTVSDLTDVGNCGACGNVCSIPENGVATCTEGSCRIACDPGFEPDESGIACEPVVVGYCRDLFSGGPGFACPTGATSFCIDEPISPSNSAHALAACEACYGVGACFHETADCAGPGYGPNPAGQYQCGNAYFGYTGGCSGDDGRAWYICSSFTTYGYWGKDGAGFRLAAFDSGERTAP